jgi:hypothetical protein
MESRKGVAPFLSPFAAETDRWITSTSRAQLVTNPSVRMYANSPTPFTVQTYRAYLVNLRQYAQSLERESNS